MDRDFQAWVIVFAAATAISVTLQMAILVAMYCGVRRFRFKVKEIAQRAQSQRSVLQEYNASAREVLEALKRFASNAAAASESIKVVMNEAAVVSRKHLTGADRVIENVLIRAEKVSESFETGQVKPLREIEAITAGLRAGLGSFFDHGGG